MIGAIFMLVLYMVPTIVAFARNARAAAGVFVINFFLGWTVVGWIGALAWAVCGVRKGQESTQAGAAAAAQTTVILPPGWTAHDNKENRNEGGEVTTVETRPGTLDGPKQRRP